MIKTFLTTSLLIVFASLTTGCTTMKQSFAGHDPEVVWMALVAVAQFPSYEDMEPSVRWDVRENEVWRAPEEGRIEIYRRLHRTITKPVNLSRTEDREWSWVVRYDRAPTPIATFSSRTSALPAWVQAEADRYFADVLHMLGEPVAGASIVDEPGGIEPATQPDGPASHPGAEPDLMDELLDPKGAPVPTGDG